VGFKRGFFQRKKQLKTPALGHKKSIDHTTDFLVRITVDSWLLDFQQGHGPCVGVEGEALGEAVTGQIASNEERRR